VYASRHAGCHTSNQTLYPHAASVALSRKLGIEGFEHLGNPRSEKYQIEIYPHSALIEIFNLPERLPYKRGGVDQRRRGNAQLVSHLLELEGSPVLRLTIPSRFDHYLNVARIATLRGRALKTNEDVLDSLVCLYVCGLYAIGASLQRFGNVESGYIVVPTVDCRPIA
jgi:predicted RNase H-like nuclease